MGLDSKLKILVLFLIICNTGFSQNKLDILTVPSGDKFTQLNEGGTSILPSGRFLTPAGTFIRISDGPYGMAISPDGKKSVTLHNGVFTIIDIPSMSSIRVPGYDKKIKSPLAHGSFLGVAFSSDSKTVYLSGGDGGRAIVVGYAAIKLNAATGSCCGS